MDIPKHDQTRKYFYTQTNVIASVADLIFSTFFYRVTNFNNSMSLARDFPDYNPYSSPPKNSRYENEPQKLTENLRANADLTSESERENKIIVFGVPEKTSDTMITVLDRISHDEKSVDELARKIGIQTLNIEDIFRLGKFNSTQTRPPPLVVKLSNTWNCRIMMMSNAKLKADNIFIKQFIEK